MKKTDPRLIWAIALSGAVMALWLVLVSALVWATLTVPERAAVGSVLGERVMLVFGAWLGGLVLIGWVLRTLHARYVGAPDRLLDQVRVVLAARTPQPLELRGTREIQALASAVNELATQRDRLRADMAAQVSEASASVQQEKDRLAALMAELQQSVVVCNQAGRILLYNQRARQAFRALSQSPQQADGAELIGIGRSIYAALERQVLAHAFERIHQAVARGEARPTAQFVTTVADGQLLRVQVAPVRAVRDAAAENPAAAATDATGTAAVADSNAGTDTPTAATTTAVTGFVLLLDNVTASVEEESERDQLLHGLTEGSRASLANIQTAVDMLGYPDIEAPMRERFLGVVREEVGAMGRRVSELAQRSAQRLKTRWPLEDMHGADLAAAAQRQLSARCGCPATLDGVDTELWLKVDSYTLLQALTYLGTRLVDEFGVRALQLRLARAGAHAQLDLVWTGQAMSNETVMGWEMDAMRFGTERTPLTVRDVLERHSGEMWFERDRIRHQALFRFLLPLASGQGENGGKGAAQAEALSPADQRPEFYDFDLFQRLDDEDSELQDRPLTELAFTVFDTETTGMNPSGGDAIIQIGAVRIVNGKLLRQETYEQLVDPGCSIPPAGIPIHGISQSMVDGQPRIEAVLPVFHAFAQDTVLVAHNAAFDMRFLQLQEEATGVVFRQPVLDTLLMSAVVHPQQESHGIEAIAERLNVTVHGRHTALGDALVTADIWLRLIPLLAQQDIHTLRQARDAAQKTYYARLQY